MSTDKEASGRARARQLARARRRAATQRRNGFFELMIAGFSHEHIAERFNTTPGAVRRIIDRQVEMRRLAAPDSYVHVQVARLNSALRGLDSGVSRGDVQSVDRLVTIVARLDRYHGLAAPALRPLAPQRRLAQERRGALPAPPRALTHQPESGALEAGAANADESFDVVKSAQE